MKIIGISLTTTTFFAVATAMWLASCSSPLKNSNFDHQMKAQGSYTCKPVVFKPTHPETPAETDNMKIRCYRDEWSLEGKSLSLHRILYNSPFCEKPIAQIDLPASHSACVLTKLDPDWIAEEDGKCMLQHLAVNTPTSVDILRDCSRAVPKFCHESKRDILFAPKKASKKPAKKETANAPDESLVIQSASKSYHATCTRYEGQ